MVQQKDTAIAKQQRRAMAQLLEQGKDESARIRVENIIRSDLTTELLEILELYCELLLGAVVTVGVRCIYVSVFASADLSTLKHTSLLFLLCLLRLELVVSL